MSETEQQSNILLHVNSYNKHFAVHFEISRECVVDSHKFLHLSVMSGKGFGPTSKTTSPKPCSKSLLLSKSDQKVPKNH